MKTKDYDLIGGRVKTSSANKREKRPWSMNEDSERKKKKDYSQERARKREEFDA